MLKTLRQIVLSKIYNYKIFAETERSVSLKLNIETIWNLHVPFVRKKKSNFPTFFKYLCNSYRAYSSSFMHAIVARMRLLLSKIFSNYVHFCLNFQIFCPFLPLFCAFSEKIARVPLLSRIGPELIAFFTWWFWKVLRELFVNTTIIETLVW